MLVRMQRLWKSTGMHISQINIFFHGDGFSLILLFIHAVGHPSLSWEASGVVFTPDTPGTSTLHTALPGELRVCRFLPVPGLPFPHHSPVAFSHSSHSATPSFCTKCGSPSQVIAVQTQCPQEQTQRLQSTSVSAPSA